MSVSRVVDISEGKRTAGYVRVTLDLASIEPRAYLDSCTEAGEIYGAYGAEPLVRINGSNAGQLRADLHYTRGHWFVSSRTAYRTLSLSDKARAYLVERLAPVVEELRADPLAGVADLARADAGRAAGLAAEMQLVADKAVGEVRRLALLERDAEAGALPDGVPAVEVLGAMTVDGLSYETCAALPWGSVFVLGGRVVGIVNGTQDTHRGYHGTVRGRAVRDWVRFHAGVTVEEFNAGALRLLYVGAPE